MEHTLLCGPCMQPQVVYARADVGVALLEAVGEEDFSRAFRDLVANGFGEDEVITLRKRRVLLLPRAQPERPEVFEDAVQDQVGERELVEMEVPAPSPSRSAFVDAQNVCAHHNIMQREHVESDSEMATCATRS